MDNSKTTVDNLEPTVDHASIETALSVVQTFVDSGVTTFVYTPGSRNAPFAYVLSAYEEAGLVCVHTFAEERGAAFFALGALQGDPVSKPIAVVTTSGTAVAELHPAMEEAKHLGLPLIAITADRPFEMIGVGSSQATRQRGLFASSVVSEVDLPALDATSFPQVRRGVANQLTRLLARAQGFGGRPGPAHLNVALREPLVPKRSPVTVMTDAPKLPVVTANRDSTDGTDIYLGGLTRDLGGLTWDEAIKSNLKTIIVGGDSGGIRESNRAYSLAQYSAGQGIPLLAEPSSRLCDLPNWIPHMPVAAELLSDEVEQVLVLGKPTLTRPIARLLAREDVRKVVVGTHDEWHDPRGTAALVTTDLTLPASSSKGAKLPVAGSPANPWLERWKETADAAGKIIATNSEVDEGGLSHLVAAKEIWRSQTDSDLWLGASNTIRAFDFAATSPGRANVFSNRGLAGIDGTIASALGLGSSRKRPVRVVLGDLSFCYDLPSLAARPEDDQDIQIVVFDDGGGSIFGSLEHGVAASPELYSKYFAVKQTIDICATGRACGWDSVRITTAEALAEALARPIRGRSLLHILLQPPGRLWKNIIDECLLGLSQNAIKGEL